MLRRNKCQRSFLPIPLIQPCVGTLQIAYNNAKSAPCQHASNQKDFEIVYIHIIALQFVDTGSENLRPYQIEGNVFSPLLSSAARRQYLKWRFLVTIRNEEKMKRKKKSHKSQWSRRLCKCLCTSCARREDKQFEACCSAIYVKKKGEFLVYDSPSLWRRCDIVASRLWI